jgi:hypothetical protein
LHCSAENAMANPAKKTLTVKQRIFLWSFPVIFTMASFFSLAVGFAGEASDPLVRSLSLLSPIFFVFMPFYMMSYGLARLVIGDSFSPLVVVGTGVFLLLFGLLLGFILVNFYKRITHR